ncbi:MAG TPA: DMT family transporter [Nitrososphaerales archaeon]
MVRSGLSSTFVTVFSIAIVMLCFAANSVITRYLVLGSYVLPFPLTIIRFLSGFAVLVLIAKSGRLGFEGNRFSKRDVLGGVFLGAYAFSISYGYSFIPAAAGALVFYSFVVLTMSSYSVVRDRERPTVRLALGQALGIIGVLVIVFGRISSVSPQGVLLMAATGISWGLYSVYGRTFKNPFGYSYGTFFVLGIVCIVLIPVSIPVLGSSAWTGISSYALGLALFMGAISTALSYVLWNWTLRRLRASQGGISQLVVPVLTSIMGVLLLSEQVSLFLVTGGALIVTGIYVNSNRSTKQKQS